MHLNPNGICPKNRPKLPESLKNRSKANTP